MIYDVNNNINFTNSLNLSWNLSISLTWTNQNITSDFVIKTYEIEVVFIMIAVFITLLYKIFIKRW